MNEESLFDRAVNTPESERGAFLDRECAGQPELRSRIEALLGADGQTQLFAPAGTVTFEIDGAETVERGTVGEAGQIIAGRYTLVEVVGEGGMGSVWRAKQTEPVKRFVAIKLIKAGMDSKQVLARFEAERQALAMMDHPNIAKILDGGLHDGRPYFAMELVKGIPITVYCDAKKLNPQQRLELFVPVCQAIQHAHQKGIIHRDIKPSNVLVALYDDKPVVKVIDFGVAKATGAALTEQTLDTGFGGLVGTPTYMSPEQATFNNLDIDTRSDVYSLGVLLYELLAGSPPFSGKELKQKGLMEILRVVREEEPPKPSTKLSTAEALPSLSANRSTEPKKLTGLLRNELDWIVLKALEKDRTRRYETANGFAADVQRYLSGEAVLAHPPSTAYRVKKFVRRHKGQVIAAGVVLAALLFGIVGTTLGLLEAQRQKADAVRARVDEHTQRTLAESNAERAAREHEAALEALRDTTDDVMLNLIGTRPTLGPTEREFLERALVRWERLAGGNGDEDDFQGIRSEGLIRVSRIRAKLDDLDAAIAGYRRGIAMREKLARAEPDVPSYRHGLSAAHLEVAHALIRQNKRREAEPHLRESRKLAEQLSAAFPKDPIYRKQVAMSRAQLGSLASGAEKLEHFRAALDLYAGLVAEFPRHPDHGDFRRLLADMHGRVAECERGEDNRAETVARWQTSIKLHSELVADYPAEPAHRVDLAMSHHNLGLVHEQFGDWDAAGKQLGAALALRVSLAADYPAIPAYRHDLGDSHNDYAGFLFRCGRVEECEEQMRTAFGIYEKLVRDFPGVPKYRFKLAVAYLGIGTLLGERRCWEEAEANLRKGVQALTALIREYSGVNEYQRALVVNQNNLGLFYIHRRRFAEAVELFDKSLLVIGGLLGRDPHAVNLRCDLAHTHQLFAEAYRDQQRPVESAEHLRKAIAVLEKCASDSPDELNPKLQLAQVYGEFGLNAARGDQKVAIEWDTKAISTLLPLLEKHPTHTPTRSALAIHYRNRATGYRRLNRFPEAVKDWSRALELSPPAEQGSVRASRASSLIRNGQGAEAIADVDAAEKQADLDVNSVYNCACVLSLASADGGAMQDKLAIRAVGLLRKAGKTDPRQLVSAKMDSDFDPIRNREDFKKLLTELEKSAPPPPEPKK